MIEVLLTTGTVRRAKLQWNHYYQRTPKPEFHSYITQEYVNNITGVENDDLQPLHMCALRSLIQIHRNEVSSERQISVNSLERESYIQKLGCLWYSGSN